MKIETISVDLVCFLRSKGMTLRQIGLAVGCKEAFISRVKAGQRSLTPNHLSLLEVNLNFPLPILLLLARRKEPLTGRFAEDLEKLKKLVPEENRYLLD